MSATAEHPARVLFDSNFVPGLLTRLVREEWDKNKKIVVNDLELEEFFTRKGLRNTAKLVAWLREQEEINLMLVQVGSSSIDIDGSTQGEFSLEKASRLQELYIGSKNPLISPLEWLTCLSRRISDVAEELLPSFDGVAGSLLGFLLRLQYSDVVYEDFFPDDD